MAKLKLEYIWLDGYTPVAGLRSKTKIIDGDFKPGFKARLHQKDLRIAIEDAQKLGIAMPAIALAAQCMNALVGGGDGDLDSSAMAKVVERMNGIQR